MGPLGPVLKRCNLSKYYDQDCRYFGDQLKSLYSKNTNQTVIAQININPFVPNASFLYPLKKCFQGLEKGCVGNKSVYLIRNKFDELVGGAGGNIVILRKKKKKLDDSFAARQFFTEQAVLFYLQF